MQVHTFNSKKKKGQIGVLVDDGWFKQPHLAKSD
jgi:hypothetical protein